MTSKETYILRCYLSEIKKTSSNWITFYVTPYTITCCETKNILLLTDKNQSSISSIHFFQMTTKMSEHASPFTFSLWNFFYSSMILSPPYTWQYSYVWFIYIFIIISIKKKKLRIQVNGFSQSIKLPVACYWSIAYSKTYSTTKHRCCCDHRTNQKMCKTFA